MIRIFIIGILIFVFIQAFGQKIMVDEPFRELTYHYYHKCIEIDSFSQLPLSIQIKTKELIEKSMTEFVNCITFTGGLIIDIDSYADSEILIQDDTIIDDTMYELYYTLSDTTINIKRFCFLISFDKNEKLYRFDWPKSSYNSRNDLSNISLIKKQALKIAKSKRYKTEVSNYSFGYYKNIDKLCWEVSFLQNTTSEEFNYSKDYKTIVIDAKSLELIEIVDSFEIIND